MSIKRLLWGSTRIALIAPSTSSTDLNSSVLHFIFESQTEALSKLSGGQQQRLYICIGLLNSPKVLVLDETLSGLNEQWINKFIEYVRMNSVNVIVITHNKNIIDLTDREIDLNFIVK